MGNGELKLIYVHMLGTNVEGKYEYAFYFVKQNLTLCNDDWKETTVGLFNEIFIPDNNTITFKLISSIPLDTITQNTCLGMKHTIDDIVALAWENINDYEEYPEDGRLVIQYGISFQEVQKKLISKGETLINI